MGGARRRMHRLLLAAAGALALHALALLGLMLLPRPPAATPPRKPVPVDLRRIPRPGPVSTDQQIEASRPRSPGKAKGVPASPPARADVPATRPTAEGGPPAWSRDWRAAEGIDRPGGPSLRLDHPERALSPGGSREGDGPAGTVREKSREERLAQEKAVVERRLEEWASDLKAKQRALPRDAYSQSLEDALGSGFNPGWDVLAGGPQGTPRSTFQAFVASWKKQAAAYGRSGNPFAGQSVEPAAHKPLHDEFIELANADRGLDSLSLGTKLQPLGAVQVEAAVSGNGWFYRLVALVRITQREDGALLAVELRGTSGNAAYDRLALGQARSLATLKLGPPKQGLETLWAFETDFSQAPLAALGCRLDDFIPKNCFHPLQKLVRSRVRLLAIY